jgi:hypothetical protein
MMKTKRVNQWLTLGANIGVLIGIFLLLVELRQNSTMMRAQSRYEVSQGIVDLMALSANNEQLASVLRRADSGEELTADEYKQFQHRSIALFRYLENLHYQYRQGLFDETEYSTQKLAWTWYLNSSEEAVKAWCVLRPSVSPDFRSEIDGVLETYTC